MRAWVLVAFSLLTICLGSSVALADKCNGTSVKAATNGNFKIDAKIDRGKNSWNYILTNTKTGKVLTGPLPLIGSHAHLDFFINAKGTRFVVLDSTAGTHLENRFMLHDSEGKLIVSLGIKEMLTPTEEYKMIRTVSHLFWLKGEDLERQPAKKELVDEPEKPITNPYGVVEGDSVTLETREGRKMVISLVDGKISPAKPEK